MARIDGIKDVNDMLKRRMKQAIRDTKQHVIVGYTAEYALFVHENKEIYPPGMRLKGLPRSSGKGHYWDPQGRAGPKFLEAPARELERDFSRMIIQMVSKGVSLIKALFITGLRLQRESQDRVQVETGNLKR